MDVIFECRFGNVSENVINGETVDV